MSFLQWSMIGNIAAAILNLVAVYLNLRAEYRFKQAEKQLLEMMQKVESGELKPARYGDEPHGLTH